MKITIFGLILALGSCKSTKPLISDDEHEGGSSNSHSEQSRDASNPDSEQNRELSHSPIEQSGDSSILHSEQGGILPGTKGSPSDSPSPPQMGENLGLDVNLLKLSALDPLWIPRVKSLISSDPFLSKYYQSTVKQAESLLSAKVHSPLDKKERLKNLPSSFLLPSTNLRYYMSFARYAWPDPQKTTTYPYKTIDGKVNQALVDLGDTTAFSKVLRNAELLAIAYAYSGRIEFAKKAQEFLQAWLLDENSGLLPEIEYGQMIPGSPSKNPTGILETRDLSRLFAVGNLLREYLKQVPEFNKDLENWKRAHFHWLKTSELGIKQQNVTNNLGSWYEAHFLGLALSLNFSDDVKLGCERLKGRIRQQIQTDGSQTHELTRNDSLSYSAFNLTALYTGALYCKASGDNFWEADDAEGALLSKAYAFFKDGVDNPARWKYTQSKAVALGEYEIPAIWEASRTLDE